MTKRCTTASYSVSDTKVPTFKVVTNFTKSTICDWVARERVITKLSTLDKKLKLRGRNIYHGGVDKLFKTTLQLLYESLGADPPTYAMLGE